MFLQSGKLNISSISGTSHSVQRIPRKNQTHKLYEMIIYITDFIKGIQNFLNRDSNKQEFENFN